MKASRWLHPLSAVAVLSAGATWLALTDVDLAVADHHYRNERDRWPLGDGPPWTWLESYGTIPALLLLATGIVLLLVGLARHHRDRTRVGLVLALAVALGPGLAVNGVFKNVWGRARPRNVERYGGPQPYRAWWQPGGPAAGPSFPSGHTTMAFILLSGAVVLPRRRWRVAAGLVAMGYGSVMGYTRIIQGAHFLSDVVFGAGIAYLVSTSLPILLDYEPPDRRSIRGEPVP